MSWSLESLFVRAYTTAAVTAQAVIDLFTDPPFTEFSNNHPIPGCPNPGDCREFTCAGDCSEASEAEGRWESDGHMLAEPYPVSPDGYYGYAEPNLGCGSYSYQEYFESSSPAADAAAEENPPQVSAVATGACGEGPVGDCSIRPEPPAGRQTSIPDTVTRVVLVHGDGFTEKWAESWDLHVQDDGRTLKLFPNSQTEPRYEHTPGFFETGHDMGVSWAKEFYEQHKRGVR